MSRQHGSTALQGGDEARLAFGPGGLDRAPPRKAASSASENGHLSSQSC